MYGSHLYVRLEISIGSRRGIPTRFRGDFRLRNHQKHGRGREL